MFFRVIQSNNATKLWQKQQETLIFQLEQEQNRYHNFQEHRRTKAIIFILSGLPVLSLLFFSTLSSTLSPFSSISFFSFLSITLSIFSFLKVSSTLTSWTIFFFTWSTKTSLLFSFCSLSSTKSPFFLDHQKTSCFIPFLLIPMSNMIYCDRRFIFNNQWYTPNSEAWDFIRREFALCRCFSDCQLRWPSLDAWRWL